MATAAKTTIFRRMAFGVSLAAGIGAVVSGVVLDSVGQGVAGAVALFVWTFLYDRTKARDRPAVDTSGSGRHSNGLLDRVQAIAWLAEGRRRTLEASAEIASIRAIDQRQRRFEAK